jgi:hypothetical protein
MFIQILTVPVVYMSFHAAKLRKKIKINQLLFNSYRWLKKYCNSLYKISEAPEAPSFISTKQKANYGVMKSEARRKMWGYYF